MGSKAILFLCLFALVLVIASEVSAARDLAETETKGVEESKYSGVDGYRRCRYKRCCRYGRCRCCRSADEVMDAETETKPQN